MIQVYLLSQDIQGNWFVAKERVVVPITVEWYLDVTAELNTRFPKIDPDWVMLSHKLFNFLPYKGPDGLDKVDILVSCKIPFQFLSKHDIKNNKIEEVDQSNKMEIMAVSSQSGG